MLQTTSTAFLTILLCVGCGATPNRSRLDKTNGRTVAQEDRSRPIAGSVADAAAPKPAPGSSVVDTRPGGTPVAQVAGTTISTGDLLQAWMYRDGGAVKDLLDELVLEALVVAESHRLGIELDPTIVLERTSQVRANLETGLRDSGSEESLEIFIEARLGLSAERYLAAISEQVTVDLLAEQCVRAWSLENERARLRVIVVTDREGIDLVEAGLAAGRPFDELARKLSVDPSSKDGGRIPDVVRSQSTMSRIAFLTKVGEIGGPIEEGGAHMFVLVEGRLEAEGGPWSSFGDRVQGSIRDQPIEDPEYWQWKAAMLERYEVTTEPLLRLVGEPKPGP
jgi:hypothetical protein